MAPGWHLPGPGGVEVEHDGAAKMPKSLHCQAVSAPRSARSKPSTVSTGVGLNAHLNAARVSRRVRGSVGDTPEVYGRHPTSAQM
jgi:hypothetical protein